MMIKQIFTLTASLALMAALGGVASAQTGNAVDYTTSSEYRTYTKSYNWTPDARNSFNTVVQAQNTELYPIFQQERTDLWPIFTPDQRVQYDSYQSPNSYYGLGLMTPDQYQLYQTNLGQRLNLTADQMVRYQTVQNGVWTSVTPVQQRYLTRYSTTVQPADWESYRSQVTGPYLANNMATQQSDSEVMERHVRVETTTTVPLGAPLQSSTVTTSTRVQPAPATNWRNKDLK